MTNLKNVDSNLLKIDKKHYKGINIYYTGYIPMKKNSWLCDGIEIKIKAINGDEENNYRKDYMKIKFNSENDLPLNKLL